ncbi:hypothetical protein [Streptomyces sp. MN13]
MKVAPCQVRSASRTSAYTGALLALYQQALCGDGNPEADTASLSPASS